MAFLARQEITDEQKQLLIDRAIKNKTNQSIEVRFILQEAVEKDKRKAKRNKPG